MSSLCVRAGGDLEGDPTDLASIAMPALDSLGHGRCCGSVAARRLCYEELALSFQSAPRALTTLWLSRNGSGAPTG
jgi:hypothetical protein